MSMKSCLAENVCMENGDDEDGYGVEDTSTNNIELYFYLNEEALN